MGFSIRLFTLTIIIYSIGCFANSIFAQHPMGHDTLIVKAKYQPHDSVFNKRNLIFEFTPVTLPRHMLIGSLYGGREFIWAYNARVGIGFFPVRRVQVGINFHPLIEFSNIRVERFSWKVGPYFKYHIVFKKMKKEIKWFSLVPGAQYGFGTIGLNPVFPDSTLPYTIYHTVSLGLGWNFRIRNQWGICVDFDLSYNFYPMNSNPGRISLFCGLGVNYILKIPRNKR